MRCLAVLAAAIAICGFSAADAAPRHKQKHKAHAPTQARAAAMPPTFATRPAWAAPQQCFTNDGYGRFLPCDVGDGQ